MDTASRRKEPRQKRAHATVNAILQAASQLFQKNGYYRTSTNHIAKKAGVSVGSLYEYFPNRESIGIALIEETSTIVLKTSRELMVKSLNDAPQQMIETMCRIVLALYEENKWPLVTLPSEVPELAPHVRVLSIERMLHRLSLIYIENHADQMTIDDPEISAKFISSATVAVIKHYVQDEFRTLSEEDFINNIVQLASRYLIGRT